MEINVMEAGQFTELPETCSSTATFFTAGTKSFKRRKPVRLENTNTDLKTKPCVFCYDIHNPSMCTKVPDINQRISIVKHKKLCYNCLGSHRVSSCQSRFACRHCHKRHHTSLCTENATKSDLSTKVTSANETTLNVVSDESGNENNLLNSQPMSNVLDSNTSENAGNIASLYSSTQMRTNVLLKTAISPVWANNQCVDANILFDEGAQRSFITEDLAKKLNLTPNGIEALRLSAFGSSNNNIRCLNKATIYLETEHGDKIPIKVLIVPMIAVPLQNHMRKVSNLEYLKGVKLAHAISSDDTFVISLLIGADYYWDIVQDKVLRGNGPTAVKSKIGYLLSGPLSVKANDETNANILNVVMSHKSEEMNLESFWKLESMGVNSEESNKENADYLSSYQQDCIEYRGGRYYAKLPWKPEHPPLTSNFNIAKSRTESVIRKFEREPGMLKKYGSIIAEQEYRGFIEKVDVTEKCGPRVHYIPHHPVRKDSVTTPIRIVYDCSCKQSLDQASLNDCLMATPPQLNDLTLILVRFRMNKYALVTDIEKAFLNVGLDEEDRDVTRFFWLSDPENPRSSLSTYRFNSVLFGATCSPFILSATVLKHLDNSNSPLADTLKRDLYVDNILSSVSTEENVIAYYKSARELMSSAGFNLRSWTSNSQVLRKLAAEENVLDTNNLVKILGLRWNVESDTISFPKHSSARSDMTEITKREILSRSSKIYGPLGLLSPVTIRSKILMQQIWKDGVNWDETCSPEIKSKWSNLSSDLENVASLEFPRCYFKTELNQPPVLHVFVDASIQAYGAVSYISNGDQTEIVMAKTRVAPLKELTLPNLELMAALVGARLAKHLNNAFHLSKIVFWSDSRIVLHWLNSSKMLKQFVKNRVDEIRRLSSPTAWRYCPGEINPADLLTRGLTADQLRHSQIWTKGPSWLSDEAKWPVLNSGIPVLHTISENEYQNENIAEIIASEDNQIQNMIDYSAFSSYGKLLRVFAYVLRFVGNCRKNHINRYTGPLRADELRESAEVLTRDCQEGVYKTEINCLKSNGKMKTDSARMRQLKLFIDEKGILRCGGRMHNAPITEFSKFPILLPANHILTSLIVRDTHEKHVHSGVNSTITHLRQVYWITAIRQCVKKILKKCVICQKVIGKPYPKPDPPPIPKARLQDSPPFTVTGVDFTGALNVRNNTGNVTKVYICLFTCAATRAVHLEVVTNLSQESFLQAFRRFASRKSTPTIMISDNASTFSAASETLKHLFESPDLTEEFSIRGIEWRFIPKRAPWYGGWWERLIGLTKTSLKKVLGRRLVNFETLQTVVTEIETILNDRPLTYISSEIDDPQPLSPSHLLYGRRISSLPYPISDLGELEDPTYLANNLSKRAKHQIMIIQHFWNRWRSEYLTSLREYHRTTGNNEQTIKVGDIVQVNDDSPRIHWKLAKVKELLPGNDGLVRAVKIRTSSGETTRPIIKLYPLEVCHDELCETIATNLKRNLTTQRCLPNREAREQARKSIQKCLSDEKDEI